LSWPHPPKTVKHCWTSSLKFRITAYSQAE
jgi:hypothetical protein